MIWKECVGFSDYEVSECGDVRRCRAGVSRRVTGKPLCPRIRPDGYLQLQLFRNSRPVTVLVHRLVAEAFIGPPPFDGAVVCHNDGFASHCHYKNLRWDTQKANCADNLVHGTRTRGERHGCAVLTADRVIEIRQLGLTGLTKAEIAQSFGVGAVAHVLARRPWAYITSDLPYHAPDTDPA